MIRNTFLACNVKFVLACTLAIAAGCSDTARVDATGKGKIRGINAIVDTPELTFLIEERLIDSASFKGVAGFAEYDDLNYNFNFDGRLSAAADLSRIATQSLDVRADSEHTLILSGSIDDPSISVWEDPERLFAETDTVFEADFYHLATSQGEVDIYFAAVGSVPIIGAAIGSLNVGERIPYREFEDGQFELIVTPKDTPGVFLFESGEIATSPATRISVGLFDPDPTITANIGAAILTDTGSSLTLPDVNSPSRLRVIHAASGTGNIDGFVNNDFNTAVFPNVAFGEISNYFDTLTFPLPTAVTPAGNAGAPILNQDISLAANSSKTIALAGDPANPVFKELDDNARPISTFPQLRLTSFSVNSGPVDIYLIDPGTTITAEASPIFFGLPFLLDTGFAGPNEGIFDMLVAAADSQIPISAALPVEFQDGKFLDIAVLDTADPTVVELRIINSN